MTDLTEAVAQAIEQADDMSGADYERLAQAAIATIYERLRSPDEGMLEIGGDAFLREPDWMTEAVRPFHADKVNFYQLKAGYEAMLAKSPLAPKGSE